MTGNPKHAMRLFTVLFGLFLIAECFNKLVEADHRSKKLIKLLLELRSEASRYRKGIGLSAEEWLKIANAEYLDKCHKSSIASWNYENNITDATQKEEERVEVWASQKTQDLSRKADEYLKYGVDISQESRRQLEFLKKTSSDPTTEENVGKLSSIQSNLMNIYASGKVDFGKNKVLDLEPGLTKLFDSSRDYEQLKKAWQGWRDATGKNMRNKYTELIGLKNMGAKENGFSSTADVWIYDDFGETKNIEATMEDIWHQVEPLYKQLHAYVRFKLTQQYPQLDSSDVIQAHLLGNMWAQEWNKIFDIVQPYKDVTEPNYDKALVNHLEAELTDKKFASEKEKLLGIATEMFKIAERYYVSIGLRPMTNEFWQRSVFVKPDNRKIICHGSAWDFYDAKDFRIKMCTEPTMDYFETIHHEQGHVQYFMAYKDQLPVYRRGANGGFHEAIGDTIALSVRTTAHLREVFNLDKANTKDDETQRKLDINYLMRRALSKVAFLPFGYLIDKWRWRVFRGEITESDYNYQWWKMRLRYQGIVPPVVRSEEDFDPGAKFHVAASVPYIRYFVSFVVQFQFLEAMCTEAQHRGPLYKCNLYQKKEAGKLMNGMLKMGASKPWPEAMEAITGQRNLKADSLINYFKPLYDWLKNENKKLHNKVGWDSDQNFLFNRN